jgi:hypothetical protein
VNEAGVVVSCADGIVAEEEVRLFTKSATFSAVLHYHFTAGAFWGPFSYFGLITGGC